MVRFLFIFLLASISNVCVGQPKIIIDPNARKTGDLSLNDIVESIEYIPLETNNECLIGVVGELLVSENYIFISCKITRRYYLFTRNGKFVAYVGNIGQGPGEYAVNNINIVHINEKDDVVTLRTRHPQSLMYYNLKGKYIKSAPFEYGGIALSNQNGYFLLKYPNFGTTPYSYALFDNDLKMITQQIKPVPYTREQQNFYAGRGTPFCQYLFNDNEYVRENVLNDTLYRINHDYSFTPAYIINAGKREVTVDLRRDSRLFEREAENYVIVTYMYETTDYLLLSYTYQSKGIHCYFNKYDNKLLHLPSQSGIPNDYDGGFDFWPKYQNNKEMFAVYDAYMFKEHQENQNKIKPLGQPKAIENFNKLAQSIDPDDNPVIVIVKMK